MIGEWLYSGRVSSSDRNGDAPAAAPPPLVTTGDGSLSLVSAAYRESYHSRHGARSEAVHVFLEGSGVAARLAAGEAADVLEVGFGTGLNALLTVDAATRSGARLRYAALERDLLPADTLAALGHRQALHDPALADALVAWRRALPRRLPATARVQLGSAELELHVGDARFARLPAGVQAVYHDAFSPAVNPELWDAAFLRRLFDALVPGGTLVSYTVQGALRRRLAAIGFDVRKVPGPPGGKREVLSARKPPQATAP